MKTAIVKRIVKEWNTVGTVTHHAPQEKRIRRVVVRLGEHFAEVIPLALHVLTHPSFDSARLARANPGGPAVLLEGLAERLSALERRGELAMPRRAVSARLLVSLAHDWALRRMHGISSRGVRDLKDMVDVVWEELRARQVGRKMK
ncbi:MAG: hypothetical protein L0Y72_17815 [Gemmataceae bacterium]|nr:hypothetical protein [Gemmataceae bacterium]